MLTAQQVHRLLCRYGKPAFKVAQKIILEEDIKNRNVREALDYFIREVWLDTEYPGLMALACKAVKGKQYVETYTDIPKEQIQRQDIKYKEET